MMEAKSRLKDLDRIDRNILNELQRMAGFRTLSCPNELA